MICIGFLVYLFNSSDRKLWRSVLWKLKPKRSWWHGNWHRARSSDMNTIGLNMYVSSPLSFRSIQLNTFQKLSSSVTISIPNVFSRLTRSLKRPHFIVHDYLFYTVAAVTSGPCTWQWFSSNVKFKQTYHLSQSVTITLSNSTVSENGSSIGMELVRYESDSIEHVTYRLP